MGLRIDVNEVQSLAEYERVRSEAKRRAVTLRKLRRVTLGDRISVMFENRETVLFQIHEAMRDEGITDRRVLEAECVAYSALLPTENELSATLLLEPPREGNARAELERLADIDAATALHIDGQSVPAVVEADTHAGDKVASVKYVRFRLSSEQRARFCDPGVVVSLSIDHPAYRAESAIRGETRRLLVEDLT
jgi:hypothetical protein